VCHDLCSSPVIWMIKSRSQRWAEHATHLKEKGSAYSLLVEISGGKRPPRRPQHRWKDNIKIYLKEIGWKVVGWIFLAQNRDKWWAALNIYPWGCIKRGELTGWGIPSFWRRTLLRGGSWQTSAVLKQHYCTYNIGNFMIHCYYNRLLITSTLAIMTFCWQQKLFSPL